MNQNILIRILSGEANLAEKEEFYSRLGEDKQEEELFYQIKSLWLKTSQSGKQANQDAEFDELWEKISRPVKQKTFNIGQKVWQYAAAILLLLCIGGLSGYFISERKSTVFAESGVQKYSATKGSVSTIEMADGTKIWLNSGSELTYREDHKTKQRLAELHGEAFFEIKHRADFPLLIRVGQIIVRDLGTTFNIKAYPEENIVETSLVEGKADILSSTGNPLVELKPGESAVYHSDDRKITIAPFQSNVLSAWRDGKFVIRDQRLEDIFAEISRWYNVEFKFENEELRDYRYTGNIKKTTTALGVIKMLKLTTKFNYKIIEKPDTPDVIIIY
ncbi:MAG: FecR domain-containing protein [Prolixibacteraceae bacterium]|jgi:ferric-dicitrate binding protein FerR (iron transport regulator)